MSEFSLGAVLPATQTPTIAISQVYESSVFEREYGFTAQYAWLPMATIRADIWASDVEELPLRPTATQSPLSPPLRLDFNKLRSVLGADRVSRIEDPTGVFYELHQMLDYGFANGQSDDQYIRLAGERFFQHLGFAEIFPYERSALDLHSLAGALVGASPVGVGVMVGFAAGGGVSTVATGGGQILLITVPLGIILCSAAARLGPEAADIVRDVIRKLLGLAPRDTAQPRHP